MPRIFVHIIVAGLLLALTGAGCARHLPVSELSDRGGDLGVRVETVMGEVVTGRLLRLDGEEIVVEVTRRETGDVSVRRFSTGEIALATVHRTKSEAGWGPIVSTVVGIAAGVLVAAIVREATL